MSENRSTGPSTSNDASSYIGTTLHPDGDPATIEKVGAVIVRNGCVLVVRKHGQPTPEYFMAGGKLEANEGREDALVRELKEELQVTVASVQFLGTYHDIAVFERVPIILHAYLVEVNGNPLPGSEVAEIAWLDRQMIPNAPISSILAGRIIPHLTTAGLI